MDGRAEHVYIDESYFQSRTSWHMHTLALAFAAQAFCGKGSAMLGMSAAKPTMQFRGERDLGMHLGN